VFKVEEIMCPKCHGIGEYMDHGLIQQKDMIVACDRCKGSGKLNAEVLIKWMMG